MKLKTLWVAMLIAAGSIGVAYATPTITNGNFDTTSPAHTNPTQFGGTAGSTCGISGRTWGGQFVSGWSGSGYSIWYPSAAAASGTQACTQYGNTGNQYLPSLVTAPTNGSMTFVGLDGQNGIQGSISQTVGGLIAGAKYTVSFYWATTQELSRTGNSWDYLQVSLGNESHNSATNNIVTHGFSGWAQQSLTFTATSTSEILNFLSFGGQEGKSFEESTGIPPFALLTGVSIKNVPEPPELALFGGGLLGLGLLTLFARRRALRRNGLDEDLA